MKEGSNKETLTSFAESTHRTSSLSSISHWCNAAIVNEASLCDLGTQVSSKSIIAPSASSNNHAKLVLELETEYESKKEIAVCIQRTSYKPHEDNLQ